MQRRRIPVLDSVFDRINILLWPRLKLVLDTNLKSVDNANAKRLGVVSKNPHYVTRRSLSLTPPPLYCIKPYLFFYIIHVIACFIIYPLSLFFV